MATALALLAFAVLCIRLTFYVNDLQKDVPAIIAREGDATRNLVSEQARQTRFEVLASLSAWEADANHRLGQALVQVRTTSAAADARTGEALALARSIADPASGIVAVADRQLSAANATLAAALNGQQGLVPAARDFLATYQVVPWMISAELDKVNHAAAPAWSAIEPEITCRDAAGRGYGGCWHSRITGLFGEAVNIGGVFTQQFPSIAKSVNGISTDVHTFTSRAVAPRGIWGNVKDVLGTSSGVVRAGAAVGLF